MRRSILLPILLGGSLTLNGCVASMAASAVGAAVRSSQSGKKTGDNRQLMQPASEACHARAASLGSVHIIDAEQRSRGIIVWGTVGEGQARQSFECKYDNDGKVSDFKLRPIAGRP